MGFWTPELETTARQSFKSGWDAVDEGKKKRLEQEEKLKDREKLINERRIYTFVNGLLTSGKATPEQGANLYDELITKNERGEPFAFPTKIETGNMIPQTTLENLPQVQVSDPMNPGKRSVTSFIPEMTDINYKKPVKTTQPKETPDQRSQRVVNQALLIDKRKLATGFGNKPVPQWLQNQILELEKSLGYPARKNTAAPASSGYTPPGIKTPTYNVDANGNVTKSWE